MGGAVGNVIDRIRFGAVADFVDVSRIGFFPWVFNVADSAITVGICLLLLDMLRQDGRERQSARRGMRLDAPLAGAPVYAIHSSFAAGGGLGS